MSDISPTTFAGTPLAAGSSSTLVTGSSGIDAVSPLRPPVLLPRPRAVGVSASMKMASTTPRFASSSSEDGGNEKKKIEQAIQQNSAVRLNLILQEIPKNLYPFVWQSLFTHQAKSGVVQAVLNFFLAADEAKTVEVHKLYALINTSDRQRTMNQIITALLYERRRHKWSDVPCLIRRELLVCVDFEKTFSRYTEHTFPTYIAQQETARNDFFGVDLTDDSDVEQECAFQRLDKRERDKRLGRAKTQATVAGMERFKSLRSKIERAEASSGTLKKTKTGRPKKEKPSLSQITPSSIVGSSANKERAKIYSHKETKIIEDLKALNCLMKEEMSKAKRDEEIGKLKTKFVVMQVRGIAYSTTFWNAPDRRRHRVRDERQQPLFSAAVFESDGRRIQDDLPENLSSLQGKAEALKKQLLVLREARSLKVSGKTYKSAGDFLQEIYSNDYDGFGVITKKFLEVGATPFVSTSDRPFHSLRYAYAVKFYGSHEDERLRPRWQASGCAERSKSGKVYVLVHPVEDYGKDGPSSVPQKVWDGDIFVDNQIVAERETSFPAWIQAGRLIDHFVAKYCSFSEYKEIYLEKYGLDQELYDLFRDLILNNPPHTEKHKLVKRMLGEWLSMFHEVRIMDEVQSYCRKHDSVLVYKQLDGTFAFSLPPETPYRLDTPKKTREEIKAVRMSRESSPAMYDSVDALSNELKRLMIDPSIKRELFPKEEEGSVESESDSVDESVAPLLTGPLGGAPQNTAPDGECAFHACFGVMQHGSVKIPAAQAWAMREEMATFLECWDSLDEVPDLLIHPQSDQTLRELIGLAMEGQWDYEQDSEEQFMEHHQDYAGYLDSLRQPARYIWLNEVHLIALLSSTTIVYWGDEVHPRDIYRPYPDVLGGYVSDFNWGGGGAVHIYAQDPGHYERFVPHQWPPPNLAPE